MIERPRKPQTNSFETAALAVVGLILLFGHLGAIGLIGPDEPRYAWIARAMATTGDWVTPRLYGQPWFEKPILYYWLAGIGFLLHLPAEYAARLPSAFAALAAAIAIAWLAAKHYEKPRALSRNPVILAPLIFAASVAGIGFARAATPDMLFSASITLAMACAATILRGRKFLRSASETPTQKGSRGVLLPSLWFGVFLGLGVLAKGPAALILAGGAVALWILATKNWRTIGLFFHPLAMVAFCVVALPWYILCAQRNPEFLHVFIFEHNFERYLTPLFQHRQPFWFFGPITLLAVLPFTALLVPLVKQGLGAYREDAWKDSPGLFFACWAIFPILFFSFSQSKLPSYILPAVPAICLLLAIAFSRAAGTPADSEFRLASSSALLGMTFIVLGIGALVWRMRMPESIREDAGAAVLGITVIAMVGGLLIAMPRISRRGSAVLFSVLLVFVLVEGPIERMLPSLDPYLSARWHANFLRNDQYPERIFTYKLARSWDYGLTFYFGRELPEWSPAHRESALVLTSPAGLREMQKMNRVSGSLEEPFKGILYVPAYPASF